MSSVSLIAFGTFGNPNGFTQTFFAGTPVEIKTLDIRGAVLIYPNSKLYSLRKEYKDGSYIITYTIYTYAKEPTSAREGSFIGSSIMFTDEIAEENITVRCLNEFHSNLISRNVQNDTLTVNHSENFSIGKPADFDKINFNLKKIDIFDSVQSTSRQLMVYCETNPSALQIILKKAVDLLNVYDTIYFTESSDIAKFVHQKNIFQFVQKDGFENEIKKLNDERKHKIQETVTEFENEKLKWENSRKQSGEDFKSKIERNKELHLANGRKIEESEKNLEKLNEVYYAFSQKIDEFLNQLKTADSLMLNNITQSYKADKNTFLENIRNLGIPELDSVSQPRSVREREIPVYSSSYYSNSGRKEAETEQSNIFKTATVILSVFLLAAVSGLAWFQFFKEPEKQIVYKEPEPEVTTEPVSELTVSALNPKPNSEAEPLILNEMNRKLTAGLKIDSVTGFVFKANPQSVEKYYKYQKKDYSKQLFENNKESFKISGIDTIYTGDLKFIPIFK
jgi:hypothetical protein